MSEITYSTQSLDHLGIVAGICRQIGLSVVISHPFQWRQKQNNEDLNQNHFFCDLNLETSWLSITDETF
jgi:hypothetical protein